jgi:hypothetical protein
VGSVGTHLGSHRIRCHHLLGFLSSSIDSLLTWTRRTSRYPVVRPLEFALSSYLQDNPRECSTSTNIHPHSSLPSSSTSSPPLSRPSTGTRAPLLTNIRLRLDSTHLAHSVTSRLSIPAPPSHMQDHPPPHLSPIQQPSHHLADMEGSSSTGVSRKRSLRACDVSAKTRPPQQEFMMLTLLLPHSRSCSGTFHSLAINL